MSIIMPHEPVDFEGMAPAVTDRRCTVIRNDGGPCGRAVPEGAPISACGQHLLDAYHYCAGLLEAELTWMDYAVEPMEQLADIAGPIVYYARLGDHIKIGTTVNIGARSNSLGFDAVLAVEPGSFDVERQRHSQFRTARVQMRGSREYFYPSPELREHIYRVKELWRHGDCDGPAR